MNNDYLWDKTGNDADIERLETLLSDLRYQPVAPPTLVQKQLVFEPRRTWFRRSLARILAGGVAGVLLVGVWFLISRRDISNETTPVSAKDTQVGAITQAPAKEGNVPRSDPEPVKTVYLPERKAARRVIAARAVAAKPPRRPERLTRQERYAYDQLMLALSITGSKFKAVSDTINRTED